MNPFFIVVVLLPLTTFSVLVLTPVRIPRCLKCSLSCLLFLCVLIFFLSLFILSLCFPGQTRSQAPTADDKLFHTEIILQKVSGKEHETARQRIDEDKVEEKFGWVHRKTLGQVDSEDDQLNSEGNESAQTSETNGGEEAKNEDNSEPSESPVFSDLEVLFLDLITVKPTTERPIKRILSSATAVAPSLGSSPSAVATMLMIHNVNATLNVSAEVYDFFSGQVLETLIIAPASVAEIRIGASLYLIRAATSLYSQGKFIVSNFFPVVYCKPGGRVSIVDSAANCDAHHLPGSPLLIKNRSDMLVHFTLRDIRTGSTFHDAYMESRQDLDLASESIDAPPYFLFHLMYSDESIKPIACRFGGQISIAGKWEDHNLRASCDAEHQPSQKELPVRVKVMNGSGMCPVNVRVILPGSDGVEDRQLDEFTLGCGESAASWVGPAAERKVLVEFPKAVSQAQRQLQCSGVLLIGEHGLYC